MSHISYSFQIEQSQLHVTDHHNNSKKIRGILTISRKKSTWGRLCTKNRTGCLSMVTFRIKSGGTPGLTVCLTTPSWCEWISVSSRSRTRTFLFTIPASRNENVVDHLQMQTPKFWRSTLILYNNIPIKPLYTYLCKFSSSES